MSEKLNVDYPTDVRARVEGAVTEVLDTGVTGDELAAAMTDRLTKVASDLLVQVFLYTAQERIKALPEVQGKALMFDILQAMGVLDEAAGVAVPKHRPRRSVGGVSP